MVVQVPVPIQDDGVAKRASALADGGAMRVRSRSIRARTFSLVLVPLMSLVGLYAFATAITARDAITLSRAISISKYVLYPIGNFEAQVEIERLYATVYLAGPNPQALAAL